MMETSDARKRREEAATCICTRNEHGFIVAANPACPDLNAAMAAYTPPEDVVGCAHYFAEHITPTGPIQRCTKCGQNYSSPAAPDVTGDPGQPVGKSEGLGDAGPAPSCSSPRRQDPAPEPDAPEVTAPADTEALAEVDALAKVLGDARIAEARQADWWTSDEDHHLLARVLRAEVEPWAAEVLAAGYVSPTTLAAHVRQAQAEVWDEGYQAFARQFLRPLDSAGQRPIELNPYRLAAGEES